MKTHTVQIINHTYTFNIDENNNSIQFIRDGKNIETIQLFDEHGVLEVATTKFTRPITDFNAVWESITNYFYAVEEEAYDVVLSFTKQEVYDIRRLEKFSQFITFEINAHSSLYIINPTNTIAHEKDLSHNVKKRMNTIFEVPSHIFNPFLGDIDMLFSFKKRLIVILTPNMVSEFLLDEYHDYHTINPVKFREKAKRFDNSHIITITPTIKKIIHGYAKSNKMHMSVKYSSTLVFTSDTQTTKILLPNPTHDMQGYVSNGCLSRVLTMHPYGTIKHCDNMLMLTTDDKRTYVSFEKEKEKKEEWEDEDDEDDEEDDYDDYDD